MTMTPSLEGIDLLASTWGRGVPHDQFDRLRREAPVCWHPEPGDTGFWAVTKHADVRTVSHDWATFSSEAGATFIPTQAAEAMLPLRLTILNMDPPNHNPSDRKSAGYGKRVSARVEPGGCPFHKKK